MRYIHVARDGRDAGLSYHNQVTRLRPDALRAYDAVGLVDETTGRPFPTIPAEPRDFFRMWLTLGVGDATDGAPSLSYFDCEKSWWLARRRLNVLLVHYRDLKTDLDGEMRRVAAFFNIPVLETIWPTLVEAATFEKMRGGGLELLPRMKQLFEGGAEQFFQKGENDRRRGVLAEEDLELYETIVRPRLSASCAAWLRRGRLGSMEPGQAAD